MSWSRRGLLLALAAVLPGCGFRPVYGRRSDDAGLAEDLRAIRLPNASGRIDYTLRQALVGELNPTGTSTAERYQLDYALSRSSEELAIQLDAVVTRIDRTIGATYTLRDLADDRVLYQGRAERTASFNVRGEPYADRIAGEDADRRATRELAVAIRQQLVAYFERREPV